MSDGRSDEQRAPSAQAEPRDGGERSKRARWIVLKFGGTSVSSRARWETIEAVVRGHIARGRRPLIVCSALSQVSNQIESLVRDGVTGKDLAPHIEELRVRHTALANELGLDASEVIEDQIEEVARVARGISLTEEVTPRLRARVMACGELLSTRLGAAWLNARGLPTAWIDARELLETDGESHHALDRARRYLSATCTHDFEPALEAKLREIGTQALLTQGFIARDESGDTALLGRGGSDTSAAYLAAKLGAERLEIWTDVPGMFTGNPRQVTGARLLRRLDYAEAAELATRGAKVLHPRCLAPLRDSEIPLHVRCTPAPGLERTVISKSTDSPAPRVKAVSARKGMMLVSMDVEGSWQRVGLIADLAGCFRTHGFSIDSLASSQTNMTVALDPAANPVGREALDRLLGDLREMCVPKIIGPVASVSVVGTSILAILHELAPLLERLETETVYLISQAANDLSLNFVVEEDAADRVVQSIHGALFPPELEDPSFGATWEELWEARRAPAPLPPAS